MSTKHLEEKRRSLEEKTKVLEERARLEKLAIDKKLLGQILQEENHTHEAAIKELEERMANLEQQMKSQYAEGDFQNQMPSEPVQEMPAPEESSNVSADVSVEAPHESYDTNLQSEAEAPQETTRKRKRGLF